MTIGAAVVASGLWFNGLEAAHNIGGKKDGYAAGAYYFFAFVATIAALFDIRQMVKKISNLQLLVRHVWRMCFAMFIAYASFFIGQRDVFPEQIQQSILLSVPVIVVVLMMFYWPIKLLATKKI